MTDTAINAGLRIALEQINAALRRHGIEPSGDYGADIERLAAIASEPLSALHRIAAIEDELIGGDWDEIEQARIIAREAIAKSKGHSL